MAQVDLVQAWKSIAVSATAERDALNELDDVGDGDAGDNHQANMQLVASTLEQTLAGGQGDVGQALLTASQVLQSKGQGATAPIYAAGLADAGQRLMGQTGIGINDLLPLLEGLLSGAQRNGSIPQGGGGLLDALVPGVMAYLGAKQRGAADIDALLDALSSARQGTYGTRRTSPPVPSFGERDTRGQLDPGAAGVGSLFEGLLRNFLQQQMQSSTQSAPTERQSSSRNTDSNFSGGVKM